MQNTAFFIENLVPGLDGKYQSAVVYNGYIYISDDYGATWDTADSVRLWVDIAVSSSGQYQVACVESGYIYTSDDYGASWTQRGISAAWISISISGTGQYQMKR